MTSVKRITTRTGQTVFRFINWTETEHREVESISLYLKDQRTHFYAIMADGTAVTISTRGGVKTALVETSEPASRHMYQLKASADFGPCFETRHGSANDRLRAAYDLLQSVLNLIDEGDCFLEW